ncbi:arylsulfatase [Sorangium sp. So ce448]|uniref:arylsulfatase n=1 Tax=Sorangium sp. So ce448 TaxID=3133314 RepID=UPI003F5E3A3A
MPLDRDLLKREILPIPDRPYVGPVMYNAQDPASHFPPIEPIKPPSKAPNVLLILLDDVGFGAAEPFGGVISTPTAKRLAEGGLRFTRFHTTALCSPTRAALLTGRNPHSVGMGCITELYTGAPGYTSMIPNTAASIAKILRYNGYSTAHFGKCHEVPVWETGPSGPFDHWPTYMGFEKFYGFVAGETNQFYPTLYDGTTYIETPHDGDYHLTTDLTNQTIKWIEQQKAMAPDKPFFIYFAPGATHAPHQIPDAWLDKYKDNEDFAKGWDELRETICKKQKSLGLIPEDAEAAVNEDVPKWDDEMFDDMRDSLRREMELYASFLQQTDEEVGRVIKTLEDLHLMENTLIIYILGDNGASAEGTFMGTFNEMIGFNGIQKPLDEQKTIIKDNIDKFGTKEAYNHYAIGWAQAMCTPYKWTKQVASFFGGTRNGMIVHWPGKDGDGKDHIVRGDRGLRHQFTYVIDVLPTILEAAGLPEPLSVDGVLQMPVEGTSFLRTFREQNAPEFRTTQYFEMFGNRGIYHNGWTAVTLHSKPWDFESNPDYEKDTWELYYTYPWGEESPHQVDWTQANNLAQREPERLAQLKNLFEITAARYNVFPLNDEKTERLEQSAPPVGTKQRYVDGSFVSDPCVINNFNRSFMITAKIEGPHGEAPNGVILARGNDFGGFGLYVKDGRLTYVYNYLGLERYYVQAESLLLPLSEAYEVRMKFTYTGTDTGEGGRVELLIKWPRENEFKPLTLVASPAVGEDPLNHTPKDLPPGQLLKTNPIIFNVDAFLMVGKKTGGPLCPDFAGSGNNRFPGKVHWAEIELTGEPAKVSPEHRLHALEAIQ